MKVYESFTSFKEQNMELTPEILERFKGGQAEIQDDSEGYLYLGEIEDIYMSTNGALTIRFAWCAKMDESDRWMNEAELNYAAPIDAGSIVTEIGGGRIALRCPYNGELTVVLFPADHESMLDPSQVEGLELAPVETGNEPSEDDVNT
jgi:hypothetical protein